MEKIINFILSSDINIPKTGVFEEKHAKPPDVDLKRFFTDRKTHSYTLGISF